MVKLYPFTELMNICNYYGFVYVQGYDSYVHVYVIVIAWA